MGPELDLRSQLERLDRLICWSEDIDEGGLTFAFRPLWQLDEPARAALALSRVRATRVYADLKLWPDAVMARLAAARLVADGTYPNTAAVFAEQGSGAVPDSREVGDIPGTKDHTMEVMRSDGGPLLCIDRASFSQRGGVLHGSFFGDGSRSENDYEEMCDLLSRRRSTNLPSLKGAKAEAILIDLPLPTPSLKRAAPRFTSCRSGVPRRGGDESSLTMDDFRSTTDWRASVEFFCGGGEFLIFDSSYPHEHIDEHFRISIERGIYRCGSCDQHRKGQARRIVLIRMVKQA